MSDREESSSGEQRQQEEDQVQSGSGLANVSKHMLNNKIDTCLWLSRILTLFFSVSYFLPFFR